MDVTPLIPEGRQIIQAYSDDGFRISGQAYSGAVFVFPDRVVPWGVAKNAADLSPDDFSTLAGERDNIDVILLGCGPSAAGIGLALRQRLKTPGPALECMDTGAACRTYNVLLAEGRRVVAALLPG